MLKDRQNKVAKDLENKELEGEEAKSFRCYSPQLDRIVEAPTKEEWEKKVQELLHGNTKE